MLRFDVLRYFILRPQLPVLCRPFSNEIVIDETEDPLTIEDNTQKELEIEKKRNKSRLQPQHFNMMHGRVPFEVPMHPIHKNVKYQRKIYGQYGSKSNVDPRICWMDKEDFDNRLEYESLLEDRTLQEMMETVKEKKRLAAEKIAIRESQIAKNLLKVDEWERQLNSKIQKKLAEAEAAKAKKEKLIEEVRRHFGFKVDPKDDRFKEMLEKKEKEQKKAEKVARKSAKEAKMLALLQEKNAQTEKPPPTEKEV